MYDCLEAKKRLAVWDEIKMEWNDRKMQEIDSEYFTVLQGGLTQMQDKLILIKEFLRGTEAILEKINEGEEYGSRESGCS